MALVLAVVLLVSACWRRSMVMRVEDMAGKSARMVRVGSSLASTKQNSLQH